MDSPLRILHTADSHIGADLPVRPRLDRPRRGDDLVQSFTRVLDWAATESVDLVIHAGDLFNSPRPSSPALAAAAEPLLRVAAGGIPVVVVPGNHERSAIPAAVLLSHPNIHIVTEPCTLTFALRSRRLAISSFPCLRREAAKKFTSALAATRWTMARADLRILAVHQAFESATCGPAGYRFGGGEDVVPRSLIPKVFDYVAAGHIHRHQALSTPSADDPVVVYSGSPDRVSFAEVNEPKGCVLVSEIGAGIVHRFLEHDVRPMFTWPMDITGLTRLQILGQVEALVTSSPPCTIAQLRLTGSTTRSTLAGMRLTALAGKLRPDVLFKVSARAIEFVPQRMVKSLPCPGSSAFVHVETPERKTLQATPTNLKTLPTACGVYVLYDMSGRLLYIGKSKNVRTRVRAHLRGKAHGNYFRGWARDVARIEVREADSELEALMLEAELIRIVRPPFNRQMRRWRGYCYLWENGKAHSQLEICRVPTPKRRCFGPFRSRHHAEEVREAVASHFGLALCPDEMPCANRLPLLCEMGAALLCNRYYKGLCSGPCAERVDRDEYRLRVLQRDALLQGTNDTPLRELEQRLESQLVQSWRDDARQEAASTAMTLRAAFDHTATLHEAERLVHGMFVLFGGINSRRIGFATREGVHFDILRNNVADARRILARHRVLTGERHANGVDRLPKTVVDCLCIAARELRRESKRYLFICRDNAAKLTELDFLDIAFDRD